MSQKRCNITVRHLAPWSTAPATIAEAILGSSYFYVSMIFPAVILGARSRAIFRKAWCVGYLWCPWAGGASRFLMAARRVPRMMCVLGCFCTPSIHVKIKVFLSTGVPDMAKECRWHAITNATPFAHASYWHLVKAEISFYFQKFRVRFCEIKHTRLLEK